MDPSGKTSNAFQNWRKNKNLLTSILVWLGGLSVILFIIIIFVYLFSVVIPLFFGAETKPEGKFALDSGKSSTVWLAMEEYAEIGARFTNRGEVRFFHSKNGKPISKVVIPRPAGTRISSFAATDPTSKPNKNEHSGWIGYGLSNGQVVVAKHHYRISFPDDKRKIDPELRFPAGKKALLIDDKRRPLLRMAMQNDEEKLTIVAVTGDKRLVLARFAKTESEDGEGFKLDRQATILPSIPHAIDHILLDKEHRNLYLISADGELSHYNVEDTESPEFKAHKRVLKAGSKVTTVSFLLGDQSLLIGDSQGKVHQWSILQENDGTKQLLFNRRFDHLKRPVTTIVSEYNRKGFIAADNAGNYGLFHTTANRKLLIKQNTNSAIAHIAIGPRDNALLIEDAAGKVNFWGVQNEHPEISWSALWGKVLYEGYKEPQYVWQSSAATDDFEPKFSLMPITFGTLKAAFYAMLLAIPLSLMGAVYTSQFMAPKMRRQVKPTIEIMEALPTVILGFLAGLWLAPFVERHLPGIVSIFLLLPFGVLIALVLTTAWNRFKQHSRLYIPEGWEALVQIPVLVAMIWFCIAISPTMEQWFFGGNVRLWLTDTVGVDFDQRNSIVVGLAMGFAVIPTIFSIAEDALFGVPRHLVRGSLALGATPWQTMMRVVLLTASPGIFSAVMIGLGRAVGETMIVLMATGNTGIMDFSPLLGLRTISANLATELPESAVGSTHFRILFLAALLLLSFTFVVNTLAEIVRQRLRKKYSTL